MLEKNFKCDSKIKANLNIFRIILISFLCACIIFVLIIGHFMKEDQGELKEIPVDLEHPYITWSGIDIICYMFGLAITLIIVLRPNKKVSTNISITPNFITIEFKNNKNSKLIKKYILDVKEIQTISYYFNKESNEKRLVFKGNTNMVTNKKANDNNKFELIFIKDSDELCNNISEVTNLQIKGF